MLLTDAALAIRSVYGVAYVHASAPRTPPRRIVFLPDDAAAVHCAIRMYNVHLTRLLAAVSAECVPTKTELRPELAAQPPRVVDLYRHLAHVFQQLTRGEFQWDDHACICTANENIFVGFLPVV